MKITFFVSGSIHSNFSYRALALAKSLYKLGNEVSIIAPSADKYNNFVCEPVDEIDGVKIIQPFQFATHRTEINLLPYLFGAFNALRAEAPDLIYIYKPTPISIVGLFGKWLWNIPVVVDIDDLGSEVMRIEGHPAHQRALVAWSERTAVAHADRLVVASTYLHDLYRHQFPQKSIYIMPNGVEADWFDGVNDERARGGGARIIEQRIVFLGSLNRQSIMEPLFQVMPNIIAQFPETRAAIIGDGKYLSYFKGEAARLGVADYITFTGWLALADVRAYLRTGDIGYNYMPNEITVKAASNMKVPQYMARGVTPLVSDLGDMPRSVDFGKAGYIAKPDDVESLESTLIYALSDPDRTAKAERAREFSSQTFLWDTLAANFQDWLGVKT